MAFTHLNNINMDEDDDELESLRLAALQSLQKKVAVPFDIRPSKPKESLPPKTYSPTNRRGRGGFHQNNRGRNGLFNNHNQRSRNPNLISIPTEAETPPPKDPPKLKSTFVKDNDSTFKLSLPQDRYCNKSVEKETNEQASSKFTRYDNSDDSESESEEEDSVESDSESTGALKKAGSLEALMQELENEIQGKSNDPKVESDTVKAPKVKRRNKRLRTRTISSTAEKDLLEENLDTEPINSPEHLEIPLKIDENITDIKAQSPEPLLDEPKVLQTAPARKPSPPLLMRNRSPPPHLLSRKRSNSPPYIQRKRSPKRPHPNYNSNSFHTFPPQYLPQQIPTYPPPFLTLPSAAFPPFGAHIDITRQPPPPFIPLSRPISPLAINTEALCTIAKAPLSPRSAAFVLQNREIIAQRRRKSPKRSPTFSRSRSPSPNRRSLSPLSRRSLSKSPIRNRGRSRSPRRLTPPPRGGRNCSPPPSRRRRSMSPGNPRRNMQGARKPPRDRRSPPKQSVRDRLGTRANEPSKVEKSSPVHKEPDPNLDDPILEARKRKFERTEITVKDGGVIKLKKEDEEPTMVQLDDVLDTKADDIFSDQSDDNDGRFKTDTPPLLSASKSTNGIQTEPINKSHAPYKRTSDAKRRRRSSSPTENQPDIQQETSANKPTKPRLIRLVKAKAPSAPAPARVTSPIESKKIEIKIRNPGKYEEIGRNMYDVATEDEMRRGDEPKVRDMKERRVDVVDDEEEEVLVEVVKDVVDVVIEDDDDGDDVEKVDEKSTDGGDLRAQLSRKRAQRKNKHRISDTIQTRLLQTALKDAVLSKKVKKSKKSKHRESALKDGKLPIHLRLGLGGSDVQIHTEHRKKSKKSKHRSLDQV